MQHFDRWKASSDANESIRILAIPPYYEVHFELVLDRLIAHNKHITYQIFTIDNKFLTTTDVNALLSMCRTVVNEQQIQTLVADSQIGQFVAAKLRQEYPQLRSGGMNFIDSVLCGNRFLMTQLIGVEECVPTLIVDTTTGQWKTNFEAAQAFLSNEPLNGYVKSIYAMDNKSSSFRFSNWKEYAETADAMIELYAEQNLITLGRLFRIYVPIKQYPILFKPGYLVQPFLSLDIYPHWRLVIASACIFDNEIIMWPLVDGYSGWPFLAKKPLAIMPIIVCPSRQISSEQQSLVYTRFRQHLTRLITIQHLRYGWIQCSYFISCENEIRLASIKPTYSVYLCEALNQITQHGHPHAALVQLSLRQRPQTPILNGKTVYVHRLWAKTTSEKFSVNDLINTIEVERIHRSNVCSNRYVRLRFRAEDIINNESKYTEVGFIQVHGEYYEAGLSNLIEFRYVLLQKPEFFPFTHHSMLLNNADQFDPVTCLPSNKLLDQLEQLRDKEHKDLV